MKNFSINIHMLFGVLILMLTSPFILAQAMIEFITKFGIRISNLMMSDYLFKNKIEK